VSFAREIHLCVFVPEVQNSASGGIEDGKHGPAGPDPTTPGGPRAHRCHLLRVHLSHRVHSGVGSTDAWCLRVGLLALGALAFAGSAQAQGQAPSGALYEMPLPGGLSKALAVIGDRAPADRAQFLLEFIRQTYRGPAETDLRRPTLKSLLAQIDAVKREPPAALTSTDTLPLPLPPTLWIDAVFGGRATPQTLVSSILQSRNAALLYYGLVSLDDETRSWLAGQPALVRELGSRRAFRLLVAAPGLRVKNGSMLVPGGEVAEPVWEALVGRPVKDPASFVREIIVEPRGQLAYFVGALGQLTASQVRALLNLNLTDVSSRIASARSVLKVFERLIAGWDMEEQPFWRPSLDPALLVADLGEDTGDKPLVPGTRRFWSQVFGEDGGNDGDKHTDADEPPVDLPWLCDHTFRTVPGWRRRYHVILFAARTIKRVERGQERDAIEALRSASSYPALVTALERAGLTDVAAYAAAARRADELSSIGDRTRAHTSIAQFQGALALLTRAASRGSVPSDSLAKYVTSLSAVQPNERGEYEGRLVRWLDESLLDPSKAADNGGGTARGPFGDGDETPNDDADDGLVQMLAGPPVVAPTFVVWEGTRYRVDLVAPEVLRLARLLGNHAPPYVSAAQSLVRIADALDRKDLTTGELKAQFDALTRVGQASQWQDAIRWKGTSVPDKSREAVGAIERSVRKSNLSAARRVAPELRLLADDLLARGLLQLAYAAALGQPERVAISAEAAAIRHDFGLVSPAGRRGTAWQLPAGGADTLRGWGVTGSVLGLDVKLADFSLVRLSIRPPSRRPMLNDEDRRVLTEAVALVRSNSLTDVERDAIASAIRRGRDKLTALRTAEEASALGDEIRLSGARRSLLDWTMAHQPERVTAFLSPTELLWLGRDRMTLQGLQAWGAPGEPRFGCLCLQLNDPRPWEAFAGRWHSGILASSFPDLNLRLAELLAELQMPATLLGPVLTSATLDFVDSAPSRDQDDWRALVAFVQGLRRDKVEQYLALLTTDGPLVPVGEADREPSSSMERPR
jgi:hypothetical protein